MVIPQWLGAGLCVSASILCTVPPGSADPAKPPENLSGGGEEEPPVVLETMEVTAVVEGTPEARPESTLGGENLRKQVANSLGKTLEQQMGVNNASFGPGVGIPVIRGLTGARIRVLQDGIGTNDASAVSPDHALTLEPLLAEEITVLRGPATIRYGSGAIGGAVEVTDGRIPDGPPAELIDGAAELRYTNNAEEKAAVAKLNAGKDWFAVHADGFYRTRNDLQIPGAAIDRQAVEEQFGLAGVPSAQGYVPNSDLTTQGGSFGWSASGRQGLLGMAVNFLNNDYGIPPGGHGVGHSHGDGQSHGEQVRVDLAQTRYDFKAELFNPFAHVEKAALRVGLVDYEHSEVDFGVRSTTFRNDVMEGRFELPFRATDFLSGTAGMHWIDRTFSATGLETFVPPSEIDMLAGYLTQRFDFEPVGIELGVRQEQQRTAPQQATHSVGELYTVPLPDSLDYSPFSFSGILDWRIAPQFTASAIFSWAERAPDVQELLSIGPHLATRTFDVGNVGLSVETARNLDLGIVWRGNWADAKLNGFYNAVRDYIYLRNQGFFFETESGRFQLRCAELGRCLPVYGYSQANAEFLGYEAETTVYLPETGWGVPKLSLFSDFVRGRFDSAELGDVPRLPPLRYGGQIGFDAPDWSAVVRLTRGEPQDHPGNDETSTPGYLLLYSNLSYRWDFKDRYGLLLFVRGDNLLDQEVRNSVSFLRSFSPEPGRSVEIGLRATF